MADQLEYQPSLPNLLEMWNAALALASQDSRSPSFDGAVYRFLQLVRSKAA